MPITAVIFDLDGTLADSIGDIGGAMNEALRDRGLPQHQLTDYKAMVGEGVEMLAEKALAKSGVDSKTLDLTAFVAEYRARYAARIEAETRPYDGIAEMLDALTAKGLSLAVLSNKRDDFTVDLVRRQFSRWKFAEVRGERSGIKRKPDPAAALDIAKTLGVEPSACAFVGDTAIDMKTARAAGMKAVGVLWGFRGRDELEPAGAQVLIDHPRQLLGAL